MTDIEKKAYETYPIHPSPTDVQITLKKGEDTHIDLRKGYTQAVIEYESLPKISGWVARDRNGALMFHISYPVREDGWFSSLNGRIAIHDDERYSDITWESEPVEVELLVRRV